MTSAQIPLSVIDWNSAIAFAGRWVRRVREEQVGAAMKIWIQMEKQQDINADNVTFNILFDVACKAGKFALAEVLLKEMEDRGMELTRFLRTGKIFYHGLKRDGEGVRTSYQSMVDAGDFIDTAVLNCVILGLIKAGEPSAAEQVFERMKGMKKDKTELPVRDWKAQKKLANALVIAARGLRGRPDRWTPVQEATPVSPTVHTYRLLIRHHALESGNIDRISELVNEMQGSGMPLPGSIFYHIFNGFSLHGGVRYSSWTKGRLDRLYMLFLQQIEKYKEVNQDSQFAKSLPHEERGCYFDSGVVGHILKAYRQCAGREQVFEIWEEIIERWQPDEQQKAYQHGWIADLRSEQPDNTAL